MALYAGSVGFVGGRNGIRQREEARVLPTVPPCRAFLPLALIPVVKKNFCPKMHFCVSYGDCVNHRKHHSACRQAHSTHRPRCPSGPLHSGQGGAPLPTQPTACLPEPSTGLRRCHAGTGEGAIFASGFIQARVIPCPNHPPSTAHQIK